MLRRTAVWVVVDLAGESCEVKIEVGESCGRESELGGAIKSRPEAVAVNG